jgi:hypothetical protein
MAKKEDYPGPDALGAKCFHCGGVEGGQIDCLPPSIDRRECTDGIHWCSGPEGLRARCEDCKQLAEER